MDTEDKMHVGFFVALVLLVVAYMVIRVNDRILVTDRYWTYELHIRYKTCHYDPNIKARRCVEHTRCTAANKGYALPPVRPIPACGMNLGDYVLENVSYIIEATLVDKNNRQARYTISERLWDKLPPGAIRSVRHSLFGRITGFVEE